MLNFIIIPLLHLLYNILLNVFSFIRNLFCGTNEFKEKDILKHLVRVNFNAWVYEGSDFLWASLLEKMWTEVEEEFGKL